MSFSDEYFALQNNTKKKKKKDEKKKSFSEQYEELQRESGDTRTIKERISDSVAPVANVTPLRVGKIALKNEIAPVVTSSKKEEKKDDRKWFQKGAFEDGYQFGDVTKTILGSVSDVSENLLSGVIGMGEKVVDTATQLGAWSYGGLTPNKYGGYDYSAEDREKAKEEAKEFISKDLYDERKIAKKLVSTSNKFRPAGILGVDTDTDSVFGEKSDSLVQSAGQLAATAGLNAVGVPWFVTTGVTSYGGELENAYKQGATFSEAGASAAITAGAEILTEKLSGGIKFGGKALDDLAVSRLSRAISNKTLRSMAKFGLDAVGEGSEEVISQVFSNLGSSLYKEENLEELLTSEEAIDEYIESFIGGAVLGGGSNVINTVKSNAQGVDAVTGLTQNEQKVIDKVYQDAVAEAEQDGKKLTQKEKDKLYNRVLEDMDKGYISTDTIEEVLGGDTYRDYKTTVDYEDTLLEEWENLGNKQNATLAEQTRYNELHERKKALEQNSQRNALKSRLSEEVFGMVQSDRLAESYNERGRRSQAFEADLTQYDSKFHGTIQRAIDSGILNNTNRTHEFVDLIAKISADKGVPFDFTNNQKLKDSGFAVEGKQVNGFVHNGNITLNIDSAKALQTTVGHEVTHVLEGTELYDALSQSVIEYAKSKGDYQGRYDSLSKLYEGVEGANIDAELTADLVGDYLFSDTDFVKNLSVQNRNVFQKIWDEVKYLCKVATAGSKEARELARVQKAFEDAYRAEGKTEGTKYSVSDKNIKDISTGYGYGESYYTMSYTQDGKVVGTLEYGEYDGNPNVKMVEVDPEYRRKGIATKLFQELQKKYPDTEIDFGMSTPDGTKLLDSITYDVTDEAVVADRQKLKDLQTELNTLQEKLDILYDTENLTDEQDAELNRLGDRWTEVYDSIRELEQSLRGKRATKTFVKTDTKYSLSDSEGVQLSPEQQEFFKDSVVRDENGNLKRMYHGTSKGGYTVFDTYGSNHGLFGQGSYFTDDPEVGLSYTEKGKGKNPELYEVYLNIKNPMDMDAPADAQAWREAVPDAVFPESGTNEQFYRAMEQYFEDEMYEKWEAASYAVEAIQGMGYDGITHVGGGRFNKSDTNRHQVYIAFEPEQIKNFNNAKPTENPDIRRSLSNKGEAPVRRRLSDIYGKDIKLETAPVEAPVAPVQDSVQVPVQEAVAENATTSPMPVAEPTSPADLAEIAKQARRENFRGAYTHNGKQYLSDGSFIAEFNTVDESLEQSKEFPAKRALKELDEAYERQLPGNYDLHTAEGGYVKVLDSLYNTKYVNALIRAIENPVFTLSNVRGGDNALLVSGENGRALLMPVRAGDNVSIAYEAQPVAEPMFPDDLAPVQTELDQLVQEQRTLEAEIQEAYNADDSDRVVQLSERYGEVVERIRVLDNEVATADADRIDSLSDADVPPEVEAPYQPQTIETKDPFEDKEIAEVGSPKVKAYMYENPEVKPFFQEEAAVMLDELKNSQKGEKWFISGDFDGYGAESYYRVGGTKRNTSADIAYLLDGGWNGGKGGYTYDEIEAGLNAIINDNGAENNACSKRIEFILNDRLLKGYKSFFTRQRVEPNQDYIRLLDEKQINEYSKEAFEAFMANADEYAPPVEEEVEPMVETNIGKMPVPEYRDMMAQQRGYDDYEAMRSQGVMLGNKYDTEDIAPVVTPANQAYEAIRPKPQKEPRMAKATPEEQARAQILTEEPKVEKKKPTAWNLFKDNIVDKGTVFETLSLKTGNRELQGRWKAIGRAEPSAQWFMEHGNASTSSLKSIRDTVEQSGKTQQFYEYLYHQHNVDRMNLADRYEDVENKPVFGYDVTSEMSKAEAAKLEAANPEFKEWAKEVYDYMTTLREMMVESGVISRETAKLWAEMYPHYVPVRRKGDEGLNINVALDTKRTGVNAPIKRATGGNRDILPLFDTMAMRTEQTFKAVARNRFGVELKNMLGTTIENEAVDIDEAIDSVETELLQEGKDGKNPTFTVFENGEKVTFEITEEMYDTMKPKSKAMGYTNKVLNTVNNVRRGLLTEYNPAFMLTNPIKDTQDVLMNSQHPARTYANYPKAIAELARKGRYYQEYMEHGGEQNTFFDGETKTFTKEKSGLSKVIGFPLEKISQANNFIERIPRMAEYIASRKEGRSIDVSMLDAARVTTDFSAGGDLVKWANRNGFTFLNASVQGAVQQVRNVREAKAEGLKGWAKLAAKVAVAGLPSILLNHLLWDDDEEYAELSDYVKQNYYIVGKYGDGKFVRIPKGRALAVIQNGFEQMENLVTGNDEVDLEAFAELVLSNLAPSNPLENNLIAPITQALSNKTWYGDDLVPTRLQDLPAEEQFDETTDSISKWLGEKLNISPYKINYVLDQYSGAVGDMLLPMITPEAERGNDTLVGNLIAPITDKFTTDSVMKNQNVSDFYTKKDELTTNAKASGATEEDVLMNKYMNSINSELSELYAEKRKIQNSDLSNAEKYDAVRGIQKQIVDLTREGLATYDDISYQSARDGEYANIGNRYFKLDDEGEWQKLSDDQVTKYKVTSAAGDSSYASDGKNHYRWYISEDGETEGWRKISGDELERQTEVTKGLGISPEAYWNNKEEYSYAYDYPENYAVAKAVGGYEAFRGYSSELYDIKADKDKNGKSISGSRKEKVADYINGLDADYYTKIILFKYEYNADDTYNYEIINYLNGREDISLEEEITILRKLGFEVDSKGNISW